MKTAALPVLPLQLPSSSALAGRVPDFIALLKRRVMLQAVFTAVVGLIIRPDELDPLLGAVSIGMAVSAGAAAALNVCHDGVHAGVMAHTANLNENMMPPPELMNLHMQH